MIRIDEIYANTFWPYVKKNIPLCRLFYCDPPGETKPENLMNYSTNDNELLYIYFHDQEPLDFDIHKPLFDQVVYRNRNCGYTHTTKQGLHCYDGPKKGALVTSEYNSEAVAEACNKYGWQSYYYFFHGWAALDWYRGYDKTFLHQPKNIKHTFLCPNNIVGGKRQHRLELFNELCKRNLVEANLISMPAVCPYEGISVQELIDYDLKLPLCIDEFDNYANNSHQITMWQQSAECLLQVVTETLFYGNRLHLTEKTFKPIVLKQPFILASCKGSLEYLRKYGFETFSSVWNESYDEDNDNERIQSIAWLLEELEHSNCREWLAEQCAPIVEHNYNHFYGGGFERILWQELENMLETLANDFRI